MRLCDTDLLEHLMDYDLDMLVIDLNTLMSVHSLNLAEQVILNCAHTFDPEQIMGIHRSFSDLLSCFNMMSLD